MQWIDVIENPTIVREKARTFGEDMVMRRFPVAPDSPAHVLLAPRERELLRFVAQGCSNKEVAARMGVAEGTVKQVLSELMHDLGLNNRTEAALWVMCHPTALDGIAVPVEPRVPAFLAA